MPKKQSTQVILSGCHDHHRHLIEIITVISSPSSWRDTNRDHIYLHMMCHDADGLFRPSENECPFTPHEESCPNGHTQRLSDGKKCLVVDR